jgi:hypothetical protein
MQQPENPIEKGDLPVFCVQAGGGGRCEPRILARDLPS